MGAAEIWDYLSTVYVTADTSGLMTLAARGRAVETGKKAQVIHIGEDESEERISLSDNPVFVIDIPFSALSEEDAGTVFDFWASTALGNGRANSFKYHHGYGGTTHTYCVRFDSDLSRGIDVGNIHNMSVRLKVLGRVS
jgi:hypothetical protein